LRRDIDRNIAPAQPALARVRERDGRIEMRAGNRAESKDERNQRRAVANVFASKARTTLQTTASQRTQWTILPRAFRSAWIYNSESAEDVDFEFAPDRVKREYLQGLR
jgi:hypothetical protein